MAITLRLVTGSILTYGQVDTNFSSLFYSASQSGSSLVLHTTGSIVQAATTTPFNLGLGLGTIATGQYSHAEGLYTVTSGDYQHAQGQYNIASSAQSAFIIGNGTAEGSRSNLVFASGSQVQITGSLVVTKNINVRESLFAGAVPPGGTSGGYFNITNYPSAIASVFNFLSRDDSDSDGFGTVAISANPEDGIALYGSTYSNTEISNIVVKKGFINATTPLLSIVSPSVQITGSLITSGTLLVGDTIVPGTPNFGVAPIAVIGQSTGGVLDIRNTNTNIVTGDTLGIVQFTGIDDATVGYTSSQIRATAAQGLGTGDAGGGILSLWTSPIGTGVSPQERMRITHQGNVGIGTTTPSYPLDVNGVTVLRSSLYMTAGGSSAVPDWYFEINGSNDLVLDDAVGSKNFIFSNSGNVGIGTTTPNVKLDVNGNTVVTGSFTVTGSATINSILTLIPRTTTPTGAEGMVMVSGSGANSHIYCYLNSTWKQLD